MTKQEAMKKAKWLGNRLDQQRGKNYPFSVGNIQFSSQRGEVLDQQVDRSKIKYALRGFILEKIYHYVQSVCSAIWTNKEVPPMTSLIDGIMEEIERVAPWL